MELLYVAWKLE